MRFNDAFGVSELFNDYHYGYDLLLFLRSTRFSAGGFLKMIRLVLNSNFPKSVLLTLILQKGGLLLREAK